MAETIIEAKNVRKEFGSDDQILESVDLEVRDNEILVLMGENGVGKTVLLSCLAGGERLSDGQVDVFGEPATADETNVGFLLQEAMGIDGLTGRENIDFYSRIYPDLTDRWREYVEEFDITDDLDKVVKNYSAGMQRKVELSICLSMEEPVYLLDEPTAGLDLSVIQTFHSMVRDLHERGRTFVIASHLPSDAEIADRIAFLRAGRISVTGTPDELLDSLPPVVRANDRGTATKLGEYVREGELFDDGGETRGFLREDASVEAINDELGADAVETVDPTYTDMFNYYVHLDETEP